MLAQVGSTKHTAYKTIAQETRLQLQKFPQ
nr:MAG TPA: hypothetical protein [Caudoviricetes sp.]DAM18740.1 MAG TPA: hypothetical protein [Caudoviricetes sp.]